jgi:hypothetical protein
MPSRLKTAGIQRRLDICLAQQANPDLTYRQLQIEFNASSSIVADALKGGAATWASMLKGEPSPGISSRAATSSRGNQDTGLAPGFQGRFIALLAEPQAGRGDPAPFRYRKVGEKEWHNVDVTGIDGMLATIDAQGWEIVYIGRTGLGHGTNAFDGAYECLFKRKR